MNSNFSNKSIFITGAAGFIGFYLAKQILETNDRTVSIIGLDNMNDYYDVSLKETRLSTLKEIASDDSKGNFTFIKGSLSDKQLIESIFDQYRPNIVVNLAAQAGVRYSITNPESYLESNLIGFYHILEACRQTYASGA